MRQRPGTSKVKPFDFAAVTKPIQNAFERRRLAREADKLLLSAGLCWDGRPPKDHHSVTLVPNSNGRRH